jgi:hypothetical protein
LQGNNIVRVVYFDEAGVSNPKHEPFIVVVGVIVHADQKLIAVENYLEQVMRRHIPAELHDNFVFNAKHLFNGDNRLFKRHDPEWPLERRLKIDDELAIIPKKFDLPIGEGWQERDSESPHLPGWEGLENTVAACHRLFAMCGDGRALDASQG